jgi:hypothetical protein
MVTRMPGFKERVQRIHLERVIHRVPDRGLAIRQSLDRRIRIDHTRPDRNVLENEVLAVRHIRGAESLSM